MKNILPSYTSFKVDERIDNTKSWDPQTTPSASVAKLLDVVERKLVPDDFVPVYRLPLPPPNERHINPHFLAQNGPSPLAGQQK